MEWNEVYPLFIRNIEVLSRKKKTNNIKCDRSWNDLYINNCELIYKDKK